MLSTVQTTECPLPSPCYMPRPRPAQSNNHVKTKGPIQPSSPAAQQPNNCQTAKIALGEAPPHSHPFPIAVPVTQVNRRTPTTRRTGQQEKAGGGGNLNRTKAGKMISLMAEFSLPKNLPCRIISFVNQLNLSSNTA